MCGIVGVIAVGEKELAPGMVDFFEDMLYHDAVRGPHSTGVMIATTKDTVRYCKSANHAYDFMYSNGYVKFKKQMTNARFLIGHNRWATVGNVNNKNAHPFMAENIMLVHNGTLRNHGNLGHDVEVDSEALAKELQKTGWEATLNKIEGDYALSWIDSKERSLNFIRNHNRPLAWTKVTYQSEPYVVLASEGEMLEWLIHRARQIYSAGKIEDFTVNTLYTLTYGEKYAGKPVVKETKFNKKYPMYHRQNFHGGYYGNGLWEAVDIPTLGPPLETIPVVLRQNRNRSAARKVEAIITPPMKGKKVLVSCEEFLPYQHKGDKGKMALYLVPYQPYLTLDEVAKLRDHEVIAFSVELAEYTKRYVDKSKIYEAVISSCYPVLGKKVEANMCIIDQNSMTYRTDLWWSEEDDDVFDARDIECLTPIKNKELPKKTLIVNPDGTVVVSDAEVLCSTCGSKHMVIDIKDGDWGSDGAYYCQKCEDESDAEWMAHKNEFTGYTGGNLI